MFSAERNSWMSPMREAARSAWSRSFWRSAACLEQRPESWSEMAMRQKRRLVAERYWQWSAAELVIVVELEVSGFYGEVYCVLPGCAGV